MFSTRIKVRTYELDALGHVNQAVYHSYAEVARVEMFAASGFQFEQLEGKAPVMLESHIVYRRELRQGDEVEVTAEPKFGTGKTFQINSQILKTDGTLSAEITATFGLMDLNARKLIADPWPLLQAAGADFAG